MKQNGNAVSVRCAIYTRKSSEEGLDQAFNSLDAQREACEAYAASQRHEGWQVLDTHYDDGGFSGGNLTRPALQRLLADIKAGEVDLVVVYKIDRLTRSLMDFSKLVEVFDAQQTSFVSVTQHFNTTSSMGRLTLNVLLSFAQFEREVTGERIRDKIAASKRKGMWMGGTAPLGYALANKTLIVDKEESAMVRQLFERYDALGCVRALKQELDQASTQGRSRRQRDGTTRSVSFSRGGLYAILNRRLYLGEVHHKGEWFTGRHAAIVSVELWQRVQAKLETNRRERQLGTNTTSSSLLAGMLFDTTGRKLLSTHTTKAGKRYRYYLIRERRGPDDSACERLCLPAHDTERIATEQWLQLVRSTDLDVQLGVNDAPESAALRNEAEQLAKRWATLAVAEQRKILLDVGFRGVARERCLEVSAEPGRLIAFFQQSQSAKVNTSRRKTRRIFRLVDTSLVKAAGETRILEETANTMACTLVPAHRELLKAIAFGRSWAKAILLGRLVSAEEIAAETGLSAAHVARGLKCIQVPGDLIERLAQGKGPSDLTWASIRPLHGSQWDAAITHWRE